MGCFLGAVGENRETEIGSNGLEDHLPVLQRTRSYFVWVYESYLPDDLSVKIGIEQFLAIIRSDGELAGD